MQTTPPPPRRHAAPQLPAPDARPGSTPLSCPGSDHQHRTQSPDGAGRMRSARAVRSTPDAADPAGRQHLGKGSHVSTRQQHPRSPRRDPASDANAQGQGDGTDGGLANKVWYPPLLLCQVCSSACRPWDTSREPAAWVLL